MKRTHIILRDQADSTTDILDRQVQPSHAQKRRRQIASSYHDLLRKINLKHIFEIKKNLDKPE